MQLDLTLGHVGPAHLQREQKRGRNPMEWKLPHGGDFFVLGPWEKHILLQQMRAWISFLFFFPLTAYCTCFLFKKPFEF